MVQGAVVRERQVQREVHVTFLEHLPRLYDLRCVFAPVRLCQVQQKTLAIARKRVERKRAGRFVHDPRIITEVPALHDRADAEFAHSFIFFVQQPWDWNERDGGDLVGTAHLDLGGRTRAVRGGVLRTATVYIARPGPREKIIQSN